jgi:siroheme synthase (precorrin-2 oxidase/ferrochelatase)
MSKTVLVVGGSGVFGSRLVERLAESTECTVLVAGRSPAKAQQLIDSLGTRQLSGVLRPMQLDRERVTAQELRDSGACVVVDAAGPFQARQPHLAHAAIAAGCHFIDLADAREYVAMFPQLDALARAHSVLAVCGASTSPALSHAVLDELAAQMGPPGEIAIAISPGNRAPRGLAVVQAVLSYAGRPVNVLEQGVVRERAGWSMLHRRALQGLGRRWFSLCETPDLDLVPQRFPTVRTVHFFAGLELSVLHLGLWLLSLLVRVRVLRSLLPYAAQLHAIAVRFERCGRDCGGMQVEATCWSTSGVCLQARWELLALAGHGPYVPILPALALLRRLLTGSETRRGAMACVGLLGLGEILAEATGLEIRTQRWSTATQPLFQRALASDFERMPALVRALHSPRGSAVFRGLADVDAGANPVARVIARCLRFPAAASQIAVQVSIQTCALGERWQRSFGGNRFSSVLACDAAAGVLTESFGPIRCTLRVSADQQGLQLAIQAAYLGRLPLPRWLTPWTRASERVDALGRFNFDVEIGLPGIGRLVRYRGWLV